MDNNSLKGMAKKIYLIIIIAVTLINVATSFSITAIIIVITTTVGINQVSTNKCWINCGWEKYWKSIINHEQLFY